jgi:hypothetical protein
MVELLVEYKVVTELKVVLVLLVLQLVPYL